jgi:hypothetical protein
MNKRIEELAEQCITQYRDGNGGYIDQVDTEKFAKLIIQECIDHIKDRTEDWNAKLHWVFNDGSGYMDVNVESVLKDHFNGVID